jgi:hypothetical protein
MKQPNRVKAAMRAGRKAYGYNLSFASPWVIDILGKLDFDFVFIDGEHGPFGLDQLEDLCRTARPERGRASNFAGDSATAKRSAGQHAHPQRAFRLVNRCVSAQS